MTAAVVEKLRAELYDNGPDALNPLPDACPACGGAVEYEQVIAWKYYPEGNGYRWACADTTCVHGKAWEVVEL